jgi:hypothetical protein
MGPSARSRSAHKAGICGWRMSMAYQRPWRSRRQREVTRTRSSDQTAGRVPPRLACMSWSSLVSLVSSRSYSWDGSASSPKAGGGTPAPPIGA